MPVPDPKDLKKAPHGPHDEPAKAAAPSPPPAPKKASEERPEPQKDDEGKPIVKPVMAGETAIPHEGEEEDVDPDRADVTVPGGRYQVGDKIVNAQGEILEDAPKAGTEKKD